MTEHLLNNSIEEILGRFDGSSGETLIRSLAAEFLQLHRAHAALAARLAVMETLQAMSDGILEAASGAVARYPARARVAADDCVLDIIGFHQLEHDQTGAPYRWTGPERYFSFHLFVDRRTPAAFVLSFGAFYAEASVKHLRGFVDGKEILLSFKGASNGWEARGAMPPRRDAGATVLTFVVPQIASPSSKGSADVRLLGLSFQSLTVETSGELAADVYRDVHRKLDMSLEGPPLEVGKGNSGEYGAQPPSSAVFAASEATSPVGAEPTLATPALTHGKANAPGSVGASAPAAHGAVVGQEAGR